MISRTKMMAMAGLVLMLSGTGLYARAENVTSLQQQEAADKALLAQDQTNYSKAKSGVAAEMTKLGQLGQQLFSAKSEEGAAAAKASADKSKLSNAEALLRSTEAEVAYTNQKLSATEALYQSTRAKVKKTEARLARERVLFSGQLQLVEEHGSVGYLSVIVGAHSFADLISRVAMLGQIAAEAAQEVDLIRGQAQAVQQEEQTLAVDKTALAEAQATLSTRQSVENQARIVVQEQEQSALSAQDQAASQVQAVATTQQEVAQEMQKYKDAELALNNDMASLRSQINHVVSEVGSLLQAFSSGNLDRQQLYQAMLPLVSPVAARFGLSPALVIAVITEESGGNESAISVTGAIGLMQLEPGTAASLGIDPYNAEQNVLGGCLYLSQMLQLFNGNLSLALSAYNAGPGAVQQNGNQVPSYTQSYVSNIEGLYSLYSSYGS